MRDGEYRIAHQGTNANHCFVARTWPESLEPVCYDAEGARTILRIEVRRFELRRTGLNQDELDEAIDREIAAGVLPVPERPAMSYMMSSAQVLFNDQGQPAGNWRPHLMLYMPHVTDEDIGVTGGPMEYLQVANPGEPTAYVVIVVPDFVNPTSR